MDPKLSNSDTEEQINFLKYAVEYLEKRINLIDNKSSILIAIQALLFAVIVYVTKEFSWTCFPDSLKTAYYIVWGVSLILATLTMLLLLQTVRPTKRIFGRYVFWERKKDENDVNYVMWFSNEFPGSEDDYLKRVQTLNTDDILANYQKTHFIGLQLIRRKYRSYRWAVRSLKVMVAWSAIGSLTFALIRIL